MSETSNEPSPKSNWKGMLSLLAILAIPLFFFVMNYFTVKENAEIKSNGNKPDSTQVTTPVDSMANPSH